MDMRLTERAEVKILKLLEKEPAGSFLRLEILGGGCAGFQYIFRIDTQRSAEDIALGAAEVFVIDAQSALYVKGAEVDFAEDMMGASFAVNNPTATSSCGCGASFSPM